MKMIFLQDRVVQDGLEGTADETAFKVGQVVELTAESAAHWFVRGVAKPAPESASKSKAKPEKVAEKVAEAADAA